MEGNEGNLSEFGNLSDFCKLNPLLLLLKPYRLREKGKKSPKIEFTPTNLQAFLARILRHRNLTRGIISVLLSFGI
ncbi:hypothetical protein ADICYQ_3107 [Cyclobacterium qasimii M12-11B]|uniref:Uncharacterized protein n=1 Tax=Cyclobacterium qasimii M12-11B TaxID=641524 RepID=S7VCQ3_9BACT|nr:hypothetical protein ADICYQ_3107 [Cyclobacterium qasimii M12-11B]